MNFKPFKDTIFSDFIIREFNEDSDDGEFIWHIDEHDRIVETVENGGGWQIQFDNKLPTLIKGVININKGEYHRLIKGKNKLIIKITEIKNGNS